MNNTHIHFNRTIKFTILLIISMIFSYVEGLLPFNVSGIGIKIGLANIVTLLAIFIFSYRYAMLIGVLRVIFLSYIFGNFIYLQLSMVGFISSFLMMALMFYIYNIDINQIDKNVNYKVVFISIAGSIAHNIAQVVVCYFILAKQSVIFNLLFFIIPIAIFTGAIVGYLSTKVLKLAKYIK